MKNKMLLPIVAVVFGVASAFASTPLTQMGWFNDDGEVGQAAITDPTDKTCAVGRDIQCSIGVLPAYETQSDAQTQNQSGLLKYNN